jgi:hypothetical protein
MVRFRSERVHGAAFIGTFLFSANVQPTAGAIALKAGRLKSGIDRRRLQLSAKVSGRVAAAGGSGYSRSILFNVLAAHSFHGAMAAARTSPSQRAGLTGDAMQDI